MVFSRVSVRRIALSAGAAGLAAAAGLALAGPASAHATVQMYGGSAAAGGYGSFWIRIGHGCDGSATKRVVVNVPASFGSAKPQMIGGWRSKVTVLPSGIRQVVWNATGAPLRDDEFQDFGVSVKFPSTEGEVLLPTIQTCLVGKLAWVDEDHAAEHPAPRLTVGPASASGH